MILDEAHPRPRGPISSDDEPVTPPDGASRCGEATPPDDAPDEQLALDQCRRDFLAMVSHEIRNPNTVVCGFLDHLVDHGSELDEELVERLLRRASENAHRVDRLVDDLITVVELGRDGFRFDLRPVPLPRPLGCVVEEVREASGRCIDFAPPADLRTALVDEDRQIQIMTNLLTNAVKFSAEESRIVVTVEDRGGQLAVSVGDQGEGISEADQRRLFRPFSQAACARQGRVRGTGLGLYVSRLLVEGQGGQIWVDSHPGEGSVFTYTAVPAERAPRTVRR
jgi:signal transduction histidine kinase